MFTNRLFNLIVGSLVLILVIQLTSVAVAPSAGSIEHTAPSKYEDRYDRMNNSSGTDGSPDVSKYEDRYDRMNNAPGTAPSYSVGKHEVRYDFMNNFPGTNH